MKLHLVYFSPTGTTRAALRHIAEACAKALPDVDVNEIDCTLPEARKHERRFSPSDVVLFGMPVYYGRIPALFHGFDRWIGGGAKAAYVVLYGDRAYEDALLELQLLCEKSGFVSVAGGAFVAQHSLNPDMGKGRPHAQDLAAQAAFGQDFARKVARSSGQSLPPLKVKGNLPHRDFTALPLVPQTDTSLCTACGICAAACPVGCIDQTNYATTEATACIACRACIKYCPADARQLPAPLAAKFAERMKMLQQQCPGNNPPEIFGL